MNALAAVSAMAEQHRDTWRGKPESYWLARLVGEVGELAGSLVGDHPDPVDHELVQIASISINWLKRRELRAPASEYGEEGE